MVRWLAVGVGLGWGAAAWACGPWLSVALVEQRADQVLAMPAGEFARELQRLVHDLPTLPFLAQPKSSWEVEAAWRRAAAQAGEGAKAEEQWRAYRLGIDPQQRALLWDPPPPAPRPADVTGAFARYLDGAEAWHAGRIDEAEAAFRDVLSLPAAERPQHTVAATYMLARAAHSREDLTGARQGYRAVRALVTEGAADPYGLALASLGWEAHLDAWVDKDVAAAARSYAQIAAAGEPSGVPSLRLLLHTTLADQPDWTSLARDPFLRSLITAWIVSEPDVAWREGESGARATRWLEAHEALGLQAQHEAAHLAWIAYQQGRWEVCERWLARADDGPLVLWLRAKLTARQGRNDEAAEQYRLAAAALASEPTWRRGGIGYVDGAWGSVTPAARAASELGAVELARGQYVPALEAFAQAHRWLDVAYLAERVLSTAELRSWVDANHPSGKTEQNPTGELSVGWSSDDAGQADPAFAARVRHLLARRLAREGELEQARPYLPPDLVAAHDKVVAALAVPEGAREDKLAARVLWDGALALREHGMELRGTEFGPDNARYGGSFELGDPLPSRAERADALLQATPDEIGRAAGSRVEPFVRFHYRRHAAELARRAASSLPRDSEDRVRVLCVAGRWIAAEDPEAADVYYKAMVNEGWNTALGAEADALRWFPSCTADQVDIEGARSTIARAGAWGCAQHGSGGWFGWGVLLLGCRRRRATGCSG